jgi:hypothetical protein
MSDKGNLSSDLSEPLCFSRTATRLTLVELQARSRVSHLLNDSFGDGGRLCAPIPQQVVEIGVRAFFRSPPPMKKALTPIVPDTDSDCT